VPAQKHLKPWRFIIPGIVLGVSILGYPVYRALYYSLHQIRLYRLGQEVFIGLENYVRLFQDPLFLLSVRTTIYFTIGNTILCLVLGLFISSILSSRGISGTGTARFLMAFYLIPFVMTQVVTGVMGRLYVWQSEYGLVNFLLGVIGIEGTGWLINQDTALLVTTITNAWRITPLGLLIFYAALATIPGELVESAEVDGASPWTVWLRIKLPMIKYHIGFVSLVILTSAFREFDLVYGLTRGGPGRATSVMSIMVYNEGVSSGNMGMANAISFSMFVVVAILAVVYVKVAKLGEMRD